MFKKTALSLAAAIILMAPAVSHATATGTVTMKVETADLQLDTEQGQARLNRRINSAIREVCQSFNARTLSEQTAMKKCVLAAKAQAAQQAMNALAASKAKTRQAINTIAVTTKNG